MAAADRNWMSALLSEPATRGMDLDDPATTVHRRELVKTKRSLYYCNRDWYRRLQRIDATAPPGLRVEIGSGGGWLQDYIPDLVTTDLLPLPFVDRVCDAEDMPFEDESVGALYMLNVLHHVIRPCRFFDEVQRVLRPGGVLAMIEPSVTPLSRFIYGRLHPEPFEPTAPQWDLEPSGPLSGGNDANPWIIFVRDRDKFQSLYPDLAIERIDHHTSMSRLFCGGVLMRSLLPGFMFPAMIGLENMTPKFLMRPFALFINIVVRKAGGE